MTSQEIVLRRPSQISKFDFWNTNEKTAITNRTFFVGNFVNYYFVCIH